MDSTSTDSDFVEDKSEHIKLPNNQLLNSLLNIIYPIKKHRKKNTNIEKWISDEDKVKIEKVVDGDKDSTFQSSSDSSRSSDEYETSSGYRSLKCFSSNNFSTGLKEQNVQPDNSERKKLKLTETVSEEVSPANGEWNNSKPKVKTFLRICCCCTKNQPTSVEEEDIQPLNPFKATVSYDSYTVSTDGLSTKQGPFYNMTESVGYKELFSENSQSSRYTLARHVNVRRTLDNENDRSKMSNMDQLTEKSATTLGTITEIEEHRALSNRLLTKSQLLIQKRKLVKEIEMPVYEGKEDEAEELFLSWLKHNINVFEYKYMGFLGEGTFGKVWSCKDIANANETVALKITKKATKYRKLALHEVHMLLRVLKNDPTGKKHVILFKGYFKVDRHFIIIFPLYGDNIYQYLKSTEYLGMRLEDVYLISYQLWEAVEYLHGLMICHTDIKPENLLFINRDYKEVPSWNDSYKYETVKVPVNPIVVLIDLGNAVSDLDSKPNLIVTRYYRPPEVYLELGWDESADIWSVGCVIFELFCGRSLFQCRGDLEHMWMIEYVLDQFPFEDIKESHLFDKFFDESGRVLTQSIDVNKLYHRLHMYRTFRESACEETEELFDLIDQCLVYDTKKRISPTAALESPIFDEARSYFE